MLRRRIDVAVLLAALACAAPTSAGAGAAAAAMPGGAATEGLVIDRLDWSGPLAPAKTVVVENDYGDIRLRSSESEGDTTVQVHTVVQRLDSDGEKLVLEVEHMGSALTVRVAYPPLAAPDPEKRAKRERRDRADLVMFVPREVALEARTRKGMIEAREIESDVDATSESGAVWIATERSVRARTGSGAIHVLLLEAEWERPMLLETDSGAIAVELPDDADLEVRAETRGAIETSYRAKIKAENGSNRARFSIGEGEQTLLLHSATGAIRVVKAPHGTELLR